MTKQQAVVMMIVLAFIKGFVVVTFGTFAIHAFLGENYALAIGLGYFAAAIHSITYNVDV